MHYTMTDEEIELLAAFEKMLEEEGEDFGTFDPNNNVYPSEEDLKYPDTPPPIPEDATCKHEKKKIVIISHKIKYLYCPSCKKDLGDV